MENSTLRITWYDTLRAIATVGVIGIHVSSDYQPASGTITGYDFWAGNVFDSLSRFSVPVFVMLSGALMLGREYPLGEFLKKRLTRLVLPFLFWSSIYTIKSFWDIVDEEGSLSFHRIAYEFFVQFRDGSSLHLWYVYMIVGVYLFIPIIGKWIRHSTRKEQLYFLGIWFLTILLNQPIFEKFKPAIELSYFSGFLGYLVWGYFLNQLAFKSSRMQNLIALGLLLLGLLTTILGTYFVLSSTKSYSSVFYEPLSPNILLYATGLFLLFKDKELKFGFCVKIRDFVSRYSYGVFLAHVLVFFKLLDFGLGWNFINPLLGIPVTIILTLIITSAIVFVVNKLPGGKYISG